MLTYVQLEVLGWLSYELILSIELGDPAILLDNSFFYLN